MRTRPRTSRRSIVSTVLVVVTTVAAFAPTPLSAATKTTKKASPSNGTDRLLPDYSTFPIALAIRRDAKSRGARKVSATLRFLEPALVAPEGTYTLKGTMDLSQRLADVAMTIQGSPEKYLFVDEAAYQKVDPQSVADVGGSWVRSSPESRPIPAGAILMDIAFATPGMIASVTKWNDKTAKSDRAKGIRRAIGTGSLEPIAAYLSPDDYESSPEIEAMIDKRGKITAVKWRLEPLAEATSEPVEFVTTYGASSTLVVTAPETDVVEYGDAVKQTQTS